MQRTEKTIKRNDVEKYISGLYNNVINSVSQAKDAKHLKTSEATFYGLRLDYGGTFNSSNSDCFIRCKTKDVNKEITLAPYQNHPNTGNGFTGGKNGYLGIPELYTVTNDGLSFNSAIIGKRLDDGSKKIIAIFIDGQFIKITE